MFDLVAERYDLLNDVLSMGQDRRWRRAVTAAVEARLGERVLDLAAGTGTVSRALAASGAECVACDFSLGMLRVGSERLRRGSHVGASGPPRVVFVAGDALALPFGAGAFDAVTISFGRLLVCEFSHLADPRLDAAYLRLLAAGLPVVARRLSPNPQAYSYLAESIGAWPDKQQLAALIRAAGWSGVRWRTLSFGVVALHQARNRAAR
jgi:demethylmenaquinone methyltransferase/2-methoxy-6-polyprenyl-1,4-benzoquinol methylase